MTASLPADPIVLLVSALLLGGALLAGYSDRLRLPAPLLFLGLGMLVGSDGLGIVQLDDANLTLAIGGVALVLILFQGGLTTKPTDLRRAAVPGALLATFGVVATAGVVAVTTRLLLGLDWSTSILLGAVTSSTDAAAVFAVLRRTPLPPRLRSLLEVESGTNDPMAVMLTVGALAAFNQPVSPMELAIFGVRQLAGGVVVGLVVGMLAAVTLNRVRLVSTGLYAVLALAAAGLGYGVAAALGASGFFAVYVVGLLIGARVPRHRRTITSFHDGLANTAEIGLFLVLGLLVSPSGFPEVALTALVVTLVLTFVARPIAVHANLWPLGYTWAERHLATWAGLRGAVPIVLATFPLVAGHPRGDLIFNVVFAVVFVSVAAQGTTIATFTRLLGLDDKDAEPWLPVAEAIPLDGVDAELVEVDVTEDLYIANRQLREVPLPAGGLLTAIVRGRRTLVPTGTTRIQAEDLLLVALPRQKNATAQVVAWARGEHRPDPVLVDAAAPPPSQAPDGGTPAPGTEGDDETSTDASRR